MDSCLASWMDMMRQRLQRHQRATQLVGATCLHCCAAVSGCIRPFSEVEGYGEATAAEAPEGDPAGGWLRAVVWEEGEDRWEGMEEEEGICWCASVGARS